MEIEIGCGKGTFLLEAAALRPGVWFIGVEAGPGYAQYCADRLVRNGITNAVMVADDARLFLKDTVPEGVISRVHVYFPDPWPKRRHRKRRLFTPELPPLLHRVLLEGGELLVATDNLPYFGEILAVMGGTPFFVRSPEREKEYGKEKAGIAFGPTNFSRKYRMQGRTLKQAVWMKAPGGEAR